MACEGSISDRLPLLCLYAAPNAETDTGDTRQHPCFRLSYPLRRPRVKGMGSFILFFRVMDRYQKDKTNGILQCRCTDHHNMVVKFLLAFDISMYK